MRTIYSLKPKKLTYEEYFNKYSDLPSKVNSYYPFMKIKNLHTTINHKPEIKNWFASVQSNEINLAVIASDEDQDKIQCFIDWGDDTNNTFDCDKTIKHKYKANGYYNLTLKVQDEKGLSSIAKDGVDIEFIQYTLNKGDNLNITASEVSGLNKDDISQVTWKNDKGDVIGTDNSLTLSNLSVGEHTYTLEVTDSNGDEFVYTVVISVSDKGNCSIQEVYRIDAYWTPRHLVDNNIAYLATNKGIKVVDIYKRKVISNLKIELVSDENKNIYPEAIKKVGNLLYIADGDGGLKIFDTDDYSFKSELILGSHAFGLDIYKNYAFIADGEEGLKIVDISNPDNPFLVSTYKDDGSGYCINVTINKNYAYLAYDKKVIILNVSNPSSPSFVSSISTKWAVDTTVLNNLLYIADGDAGIKIVNVSNKQKPKIIYSLKTNFAHHIELKDNSKKNLT